MFCPSCGNKMTKAISLALSEDRYTDPNYDWSSEDDQDLSEKYGCSNKCFHEKDYPLVKHHIDNMRKAPGDSWSLTWLK